MYLENIFSSSEIKRVLSAESAAFEKIDTFFKSTLANAAKFINGQVFLKKNPKLIENLSNFNSSVDYIMKQLAAFLETKRGDFPRFCFLSDDELLEILAKQSEPNAILGFLKQLFDGLVNLRLSETNESTHMLSREGESVAFKRPVKHLAKVEEWLNKI